MDQQSSNFTESSPSQSEIRQALDDNKKARDDLGPSKIEKTINNAVNVTQRHGSNTAFAALTGIGSVAGMGIVNMAPAGANTAAPIHQTVEAPNLKIADPGNIFPGTNGTVVNKAPEAAKVTVEPGQTLYDIAAGHGVSLSALEAANPGITNPSKIFPGQPIEIPGTNGTVVNKAPEAANPGITNPSKIFPGDVVVMPSSNNAQVITPAETPAAVPAPKSETSATPETLISPPYTAEKYVISVLKLLAQKQGIPESNTVTQEHINGLLAWGWLEEGDLGNTGAYNLFNSGLNDPKLLATEHRADGVQSFNSFDNGVLATVETMLGSNQNRIAKLMSDPNVTAEQFFEGMTYYQRYPGNTYWAQADSDVTLGGITYTQTGYLQSLQSRYNAVMSDYTKHASILMGQGNAISKGLYAPQSALLYTGNGPVAPPAPPVTAPPTTKPKDTTKSEDAPRYKHSIKKKPETETQTNQSDQSSANSKPTGTPSDPTGISSNFFRPN